MKGVVMKIEETINQKEKRLFCEWKDCWKKGRKQLLGKKLDAEKFVPDGVVDEDVFLTEDCRFVFILKETNQIGQTTLTEFLRNGAPGNGGHTWNPVCRWLTGEDRVFSVDERASILRRIAVVNLKKEDGVSVTDMSRLGRVVELDREYIKAQLSFYGEHDPVFYICCGSGLLTMLRKCVLGDAEIQRKGSLCYIRPSCDREVYYVAFNHPNCRQSGLIEKFKDIRTMVRNSCMEGPTCGGKPGSTR